MFINITGIDLFYQNVGMTFANVLGSDVHGYQYSCSIDLFDQIRDMACVEIKLRCSWKSLVLIYLI